MCNWDRKMNKRVNVPQPNLVSNYNTPMGGGRQMDWMINKYRITIRTKKWYFPVLTNPIDIDSINARIL